MVLQCFRSLLAFPVWLFNANNYGNTRLGNKALNADLPGGFYKRAGVVRPLVKLKFDGRLVGLFVVLEGVVVVVLWVGLVWLFVPWWGRGGGTAFPLVDFLVGAEVEMGKGLVGEKEVVERLGGARVRASGGEPA